MNNKISQAFGVFKDTSEGDYDKRCLTFPVSGEKIDMSSETGRYVPNVGLWVRMHPQKSEIYISALKHLAVLEKSSNKLLDGMRKRKASNVKIAAKTEEMTLGIMSQFLSKTIKELYGTALEDGHIEFNAADSNERAAVLSQYKGLTNIIMNNMTELENTKDLDILELMYDPIVTAEVVDDTAKKSGND